MPRTISSRTSPRWIIVTALMLAAQIPAVSSSAATSLAVDRGTSPPAFDELLILANEASESGAHAASARLYARAYRALPAAQRIGEEGEITVDNALDNYLLAHEQDPKDAALLEEPIELLDEFWSDRARPGITTGANDSPPEMVIDREQLRQKLYTLRQAQASAVVAPDDPPTESSGDPPTESSDDPPDNSPEDPPTESSDDPPTESSDERVELPGPEPSDPIETEPANPPEPVTPIERSAAGRTIGWVLTGSAIAALAGGAGLIALGTVTRRESSARANETLASFGGNAAQREEYRGELTTWVDGWHTVAIVEIAVGSVLCAASVGLATWGAFRLRRSDRRYARRKASAIPTISRKQLGLAMTFAF